MQICDACNERPAQISVKQSQNGLLRTYKLCNSCYEERAQFSNNHALGSSLFDSFFSGTPFSRNTVPLQKREPASVNIIDYFSDRAKKVLEHSAQAASELNASSIDTEHLLIGLAEEEEMGAPILEKLNIAPDELIGYLKENAIAGTEEKERIDLSPRAKKALELAFYIAKELKHNYVGSEHILLGLIKEGEGLAFQTLKKYGVDFDTATQALTKLFGKDTQKKTKKEDSKTPNLDAHSLDLTAEAEKGKLDPVIGRSDEITRVIQVLSRRTKNNPVLIGEPGVGKTAIAEGLAQKITAGNIPENLKQKRVIALDLASLLSGTKFRGEFEKRLKKIIEEIKEHSEDIILFIDELHTLVGAGATEGAMDAANILKPALARGELRTIGATTLNEYKKHIEKDSALERRFQPVLVGEPNVDVSIEILKGLRDKYEAHHKVKITTEAIVAAAHLSDRYIQDRFLPDKAIDLIDEAAAKVRLKAITTPEKIHELEKEIKRLKKEQEASDKSKNKKQALLHTKEIEKAEEELAKVKTSWEKEKGTEKSEVTAEDIQELVSSWTGIPVTDLSDEETEKLLKLEQRLGEQIIGQSEAIQAVSEAIRRGRAGLKDPKRPIGSFIFLGPTGVGKTELTKALAHQMFGDEDAMIRIDMSEYMERHTVSRLIGSPPGYVGHEEGGQLTEKVRRKPYSVILLDEIEKAHPDVFNILLQILEDGRLTDSKGRVVDFKNTVIIATSNIGSRLITQSDNRELGFEDPENGKKKNNGEVTKDLKESLMSELKNYFRPEFLNRVDEIIVFHSLSEKQIGSIVDLMLTELEELLAGQNLKLSITKKAKTALGKEGYDPSFGARPLRRIIQKKIENPLSTRILDGKFIAGDTVHINLDKKGFTFTKKK
jgi:ATP-dependent Clp protease ATP-binding subunit ClpC